MSSSALAQKSFALHTRNIQKALSIYRAVNQSLRLQIIEVIHRAGTIDVIPIIHKLRLDHPVISGHLKTLRDAKIVIRKRKGNTVFYSINYLQVHRISILAEKLVPYRSDVSGFHYDINRKPTIKSKEEAIRFTPMELKVIGLVCQENSSEEIASKLGIAKRTVEDYRSNIIKKMKVRNSVGILFFAIKNGLLKV
jgi:DNA-binding CsgD family transcriptional regulator/DNA-binding transcriptional ArsR family regulator